MNKNLKKLLIGVIALIVAIPFILIILFIYNIKFKTTDIKTYTNQQNNYKVVFKQIGEPEWPFGRTKVKVVLLNKNNWRIDSITDYISNDGKNAGEENIVVIWYNDRVEVVLSGEEQSDITHKMKY